MTVETTGLLSVRFLDCITNIIIIAMKELNLLNIFAS